MTGYHGFYPAKLTWLNLGAERIRRFLYDPYNTPLTNNHAERQIRHYVVYRKNSYFTQSGRGNRLLERLILLHLTCKQQNLNLFKELTKLAAA